MSYIGQGLPADSFQGFTTDSFTGDGSATTFTLSKEPFSEDTLIVVINNVIQKPTTNFTVSGTTLTIVGTAVADGDVIYAIHMGGPLPIGEANKLDINGASDQLILDLDGDTTISADTDDQIDFKAGGTDIMSLTATTVTINDGTTITVDDNTDNLTLTSTDADANAGPNLRLYRNSSSPADHDIVGQIDFEGRNDNSEDIVYAKIFGSPKDVSDGTEDGGFFLHTMLAGSDVSRMGMSSSQTVFNDDSNDIDFRVESNSNSHMLFVDAGDDRVAINNSSPTRTFSIGGDGIAALEGSSNALTFYDSSTLRGYVTSQSFGDFDGDGLGILTATGEPIKFFTNGGERVRIRSDGDVLIATTDQYAYDNTSDAGVTINAIGLASFARQSGAPIVSNRMTNDGTVIALYQGGSEEGTITVSGSTISYNAFTGGHWSRLADNSKPTILRGTVMESLNEMCDWYAVEFEVEKTSKRQAYALKDGESVGDTITYRYLDGNDYSAKIIKEGDVKHVKCKISDTADSKKVYGVFHRWDDADDGSDGDVNDLEVAQVGTYIIRVNKDVTVEAGDLLVSNGDGTAKKQDDDIIRSKTVAKVNSNIKVETYSDGSYTVPCTLHC